MLTQCPACKGMILECVSPGGVTNWSDFSYQPGSLWLCKKCGTLIQLNLKGSIIRTWSGTREATPEEQKRKEQEQRERQQQEWRNTGCCEICGAKLGFLDKIGGHTHCKLHRDK